MAKSQNAALVAAIVQATTSVLKQRPLTETKPHEHLVQVGLSDEPTTVLTSRAVRPEELAQEIAQAAAATPEGKFLGSTEKPWQSRSWWSAVISVGSILAGGLGYSLPSEYNEELAAVLVMAGNSLAAYLANRARKATRPLGA